MKNDNDKKEYVKKYYGRELQGMQDLKAGACSCSEELLHPSVKEIESENNKLKKILADRLLEV